MTGLGQVTNTRTVDVALGDMIQRLERLEPTRAVTRLLTEARRFRITMQGWEGQPPASGEQFQVIGDVMQLLGTASQVVEAAGGDPGGPVPRTTPAGTAPLGRPTPAQATPVLHPTPAQATPAQAVTGASSAAAGGVPPTRPTPERPMTADQPTPRGGIPAPGVPGPRPRQSSRPPAPSDKARKHQIGRVTRGGVPPSAESSDPAPAPSSSSGIRLLRPYMMPWQPAPTTAGVKLKQLHEDSSESHCHCLVRLESGAELPAHSHGTSELIYVLEGCVTHGDALVHAGECVCFEEGSSSGALRSRGESLLLLVGSDRAWLLS
ncbi:MAG: cupin domain-containing protein [Deltaproteobacteria bacterium]|nr:cupin domain-containing protein [Deltaproteobacteria bacterium]